MIKYDQIFVLKDGEIQETGTYEELLAKKGVLYQMAAGAFEIKENLQSSGIVMHG